jgi:hypothetical protein
MDIRKIWSEDVGVTFSSFYNIIGIWHNRPLVKIVGENAKKWNVLIYILALSPLDTFYYKTPIAVM